MTRNGKPKGRGRNEAPKSMKATQAPKPVGRGKSPNRRSSSRRDDRFFTVRELSEAAGIPMPYMHPIPTRYRQTESESASSAPQPPALHPAAPNRADGVAAPESANPVGPDPGQYLRGLMHRANSRDPVVLQELHQVLDAEPTIWRQVGDLSRMVTADLIGQICEGGVFVTEALNRKLAEMRTELAGPSPTPLIAMAVDRVLVCWLQLQRLELLGPAAGPDGAPDQKSWLKRSHEADTRLQSAMRTLDALTRKRQKAGRSKSATGPGAQDTTGAAI